jgi:hypothetical protein
MLQGDDGGKRLSESGGGYPPMMSSLSIDGDDFSFQLRNSIREVTTGLTFE